MISEEPSSSLQTLCLFAGHLNFFPKWTRNKKNLFDYRYLFCLCFFIVKGAMWIPEHLNKTWKFQKKMNTKQQIKCRRVGFGVLNSIVGVYVSLFRIQWLLTLKAWLFFLPPYLIIGIVIFLPCCVNHLSSLVYIVRWMILPVEGEKKTQQQKKIDLTLLFVE